MSLLAIIFIAIIIPFVVIFLGFIWFYIRSRIAKLAATQKPRSRKSHSGYRTRFGLVPEPSTMTSGYSTINAKPVLGGYKPTYKPLSHFLGSTNKVSAVSDTIIEEVDPSQKLTTIPGISSHLAQELQNLGYSSVEQIARWGRADVRAVSTNLGIEQQHIEEVWIANARLLMAIRSTSFTS